MTLDADALEHNLAVMAGFCRAHGVSLAPHGKTTMAPQLFARQLEAGAWGITCATPAHLRVYRAFGVPRVFYGNELMDEDTLAWLAAELDADPGFTFLGFVDSSRRRRLMDQALHAAGSRRPVEVVWRSARAAAGAGCGTWPRGWRSPRRCARRGTCAWPASPGSRAPCRARGPAARRRPGPGAGLPGADART